AVVCVRARVTPRLTRGPPPRGGRRPPPPPERAVAAARLLGAYDTLRKPQQYRISAGERTRREWTEAAARAELGDTAYERTHAEGGDLTLAEAIALV
ncbi:hypothetical protein, partial [Streptomyces sp. NPDC059455]|uniref:hypothetical protein n=1 Tax=Streptomyces sp. NPDC059455 TaxID=3346837 RepID=UPI0036CF91A9